MIVFDMDILSMFAKIDAVDLLKRLFGEKAVMTSKIRDEISVPLEYGFSTKSDLDDKDSAFKQCSIGKEYGRFRENLRLGKG